MRRFVVKNLRKSIENLNKRIDELEAGDLDILKELLSALEFLLEEVGDPTPAIDKYNEIISFLDLIENTSKLKSLLDDIRNSIPEAPVQSDWAEDDVNDQAYIKNKPNLSVVATSGSYNDLSDKPDLANVATSGSYEDLSNKPHIPEDPVLSDWAENDTTDQAYIKNKPNLSSVATSGSYNDLIDKPTIPAALIQSDWAQDDNTLVDYIKNKPTIPTKLSDLQNDVDVSVDANGHDYIEIAGVKWATMNIGASSITDGGLYFLWGDTQGYTADLVGAEPKKPFVWNDYKYNNGVTKNITKYNDADNKRTLDFSDDAARVNWGGDWRIPTQEEWIALAEATTISWDDNYNGSGVSGYVLTDKTDNNKKLFFLATGWCDNGRIIIDQYANDSDDDHFATFWGNSIYSHTPTQDYAGYENAKVYHFAWGVQNNGFIQGPLNQPRYQGLAIRAVLNELNTLNKVAITGDYNDLNNKPTIPAEQIQSDWNQSDTTAKDYIKNKPTIPTKLSDLQNDSGFIPAATTVNANGHEYIEIAGIKWATMNIGASGITDYGLHFQWGDIQGYNTSQVGSDSGKKSFEWEDYKYADTITTPGETVITKYNSTDGKTVLESSDDVAAVNWGGSWRMPTTAEWVALGNAVNAVWTSDYNSTGVAGLVCTDKIDSSKVLFFPAGGDCSDNAVIGVGTMGEYWSASADDHDKEAASFLAFNGNELYWDSAFDRYVGCLIRGVLDETSTLHKVATTGDYNDLVNKPIIRVVNLTQNLANETSTISGVENSGKTEVVIYNNTTDESHFVMVSTINKTPTGKLLELIAPVGGYCEVSYINIDGIVFAKGLIVKNDDDNDSLYDNDGDWIVAEFDVDDATTATKIYGGLYSYAYLYGFARLGAIVIDDVTVISKSQRNGPYNGYDRSFVYKFNSEGIHKVKYEVTPGEAGGLFSGCTKLVRINLPSSETLIGREYFSGCTNLKRINSDTDGVFNIPNGVTYIGKDCFNGCSSLTTINIPESVDTISDYYINISSNGYHGGSVFLNCENLTTINVDSDNTTYDSRNDCNAIIKTENNQLVLGCKNTTIPNTVTSIGTGAFSGCKGMTSFTIPNSIVTIEDRAFEYCDLLEINIPASVKYIGESVFDGCSSLKRINSNTDGVFNVLSLPVTIGGFFSDNSHVFLGCPLLDTLNISSTATEEISSSNSSYNTSVSERTTSNCQGTFSKFNHIVVDQNNPIYDSRNNCDAIIRTADNSLVVGCKNTIIPSTVTSIEYFAFNGCPVQTITIPGTVTTIKALAFTGASLRSVTIQEGTTTVEGGAFNKCNYLTTMSISSTVTSIGPDGLQNLTTITVDPNNTVYDSRDNCNAVIETSTNKLIIGASGTVVVPQTVTEIGTSAFAQRQISSITLPNSIVTIGGSAFTSGSGYESRVYKINSDEDGVYNLPTGLKTIGSGAFYGQKSLIELNLPEGITSLGTGCFENCSNLRRVNSDVDGIANIPESVTSIDMHIFRFCDGIGKIIFSSIVPPTMSSWTTLGHQTIYVPTESLEAYKTAAGARAGYIHPISELED